MSGGSGEAGTHTVGDAGAPYCIECSGLAEEYVWPCVLGETNYAVVQKVASLLADLRAATPASEVREEWGVRYELRSGGTWRRDYVDAADSRDDAEYKRDVVIPRRPRMWRNPTLVRRTVTTTDWTEVPTEEER